MNDKGEKYSLIYKEKGHIFNLPMCVVLFIFSEETLFRKQEILAVYLTSEEGRLQKNNKFSLTYIGGVNVYKF